MISAKTIVGICIVSVAVVLAVVGVFRLFGVEDVAIPAAVSASVAASVYSVSTTSKKRRRRTAAETA